jgi:hypothetical protein
MSRLHPSLDTGSAERQPQRKGTRVIIAVAVIAWVAGVVWGLFRIQAYASTPGVAAAAPASWPGSKLVSPARGRSTLVMFIHPQCACTRASLAELATVLEKSRGALDAWVVVLEPRGMGKGWAESPTWNEARHLPGVSVVMDAEGHEADRFGAATSGHVVLYNPEGQLVFSGGITSARGHVGENAGRTRVLQLVETGSADNNGHEVYGCGLHDPHPRDSHPGDELSPAHEHVHTTS